MAEVAAEFDRTHDVHRAAAVGSVDRVIAPEELRPVVAELVAAPVAGADVLVGALAGSGADGSGNNGSGADGSGADGSGADGSVPTAGGSADASSARRAGTSAMPV